MSNEDKEPRANVSWRAYIQLSNGQTIEGRVRELFDNTVIVYSDDRAPPVHEVVTLCVHMPDIDRPERLLKIQSHVLPSFVVLQSYQYRIESQWQDLQQNARQMIQAWIKRLSPV